MVKFIPIWILSSALLFGQGCQYEVIVPLGAGDLENNPGTSQLAVLWDGGPQQRIRMMCSYHLGPLASTPITITGLAVRGSPLFGNDGSLGAGSFGSLEVRMATGTTPANLMDPADFDSNLASDLKVLRPPVPLLTMATASGPIGQWVDIPLAETFSLIPGPNTRLVVEFRSCGGVGEMADPSGGIGSLDCATVPNHTRTLWATPFGNCNGNSGPLGSGASPVLRLRYQVTAQPAWQENSPESTVRINGAVSDSFRGPGRSIVRGGATAVVSLETIHTGAPIIPVFSFKPSLDATCGQAFVSAGGQRYHGDLSGGWWSPSLDCTLPIPAPVLAIPFVSPGPFFTSLQMAVCHPSHPDGYFISGVSELEVVPTTPLPAPISSTLVEGESLEIDVGAIDFYGTTYTRMFLHENGILSFGAWDHRDQFTSVGFASIADEGVPFVGAWFPYGTAGASYDVESPTPTSFKATWNDVVVGVGFTASFSVEIEASTGVIEIDGIDALALGQNQNLLIGATPGAHPQTLDPGVSRSLIAGTAGYAGSDREMLYFQGTPFDLTLLVGLATRIRLVPNGNGYTWEALP